MRLLCGPCAISLGRVRCSTVTGGACSLCREPGIIGESRLHGPCDKVCDITKLMAINVDGKPLHFCEDHGRVLREGIT